MKRERWNSWRTVAVFLAAGLAVAITEVGGLSGKWEDAVVFTVILFASLTLLYRSSWSELHFWRILLFTFVLHTLVVAVFFRNLIGSHGVPGLVMTAVTTIEGILIIITWDRLKARSTKQGL
jgi:hypothetical protein